MKWKLIGSAGSLEGVAATVVENWGWSTAEPVPTDDPNVWQVRGPKGIAEGLRFRRHGARYRFEME